MNRTDRRPQEFRTRDPYEDRAYYDDRDMRSREGDRAYDDRGMNAPLPPLASAGGMAPAYWPYGVAGDRYADPYADARGGPRYRGDPAYRGGYGGPEGRDHDRGFMDRAADEVQSWFGDDAAEHRREQDHRGKGPKGHRRSDERIAEDVNDRLTEDDAVDATEIDVSVREREVTLDGTVDSRMAKRRAEDCADAVSGVEHVQNNLRISRPAGTSEERAML